MTVMKYCVGSDGYIDVIENKLEKLQEFVGGHIEVVPLFRHKKRTINLVCDEEGKYDGSAPNMWLVNTSGKVVDIICGDFLVMAADDMTEDFVDITEAEAEKARSYFWEGEPV